MAFRSQNQFCLEIQPVSLHFSYSSSWSEAQTLSTICLPWVLSVIQLWQNNAQWKLICSEAGRADVLWRHACNQFALVLSVPGTRVLLPSTLAPHGLWAVPEWNNYCFSKRKIKHSYRDIFLHSVWAHTMPRLAPPPGTVTNIIQEISSPKIPLHAVCFKIIKTVSQHMILGSLQHFKHTEWRKKNNTSKKATMS